MAYINAEETKVKRDKLKQAFPKFKFSVRNDNHLSINVSILSGPLELPYHVTDKYRNPFEVSQVDGRGCSINQYWYQEHYSIDHHPLNAQWLPVLQGILGILYEGNHDNSEPQTDYFDVGWYVNLELGHWNKPYEVKL